MDSAGSATGAILSCCIVDVDIVDIVIDLTEHNTGMGDQLSNC
jgi:hypothetical protein